MEVAPQGGKYRAAEFCLHQVCEIGFRHGGVAGIGQFGCVGKGQQGALCVCGPGGVALQQGCEGGDGAGSVGQGFGCNGQVPLQVYGCVCGVCQKGEALEEAVLQGVNSGKYGAFQLGSVGGAGLEQADDFAYIEGVFVGCGPDPVPQAGAKICFLESCEGCAHALRGEVGACGKVALLAHPAGGVASFVQGQGFLVLAGV